MPNVDLVPRQQHGHFLEEIDGENLLYGSVAKKAFHLNESASAVWKLCDGTRTIQEIVDLLAQAYHGDPSVIRGDVMQTIDQLVREGVLALWERSSLTRS